MAKSRTPRNRDGSLSKDRIVDTAIDLLDKSGEDGLTFRALSEKLATGPGALYWHVANKSELLTAACDAVIAATINACAIAGTPAATIRALALAMFDAIDSHPWVGSALTRVPGQLPTVRILEGIGRQVDALGVPGDEQWATAGALLNYILGVAGQNAANGQCARAQSLNRADFLEALSQTWLRLDPDQYPFTRSVAAQLRTHDDRADFLSGIDLILAGIQSR